MGNQRQLLKDKLEKELLLKIQEAKDVLSKLNKNLEINKQNSLCAHEDIRIAMDLIRGVLMQREKELLKEVEFLHNDQERSLKEAIKSTYMTLGSLQCTLTNLDSFDQGQLVKLQIPDVNWTCAENEPAKITSSVDCEDLKEELKEWGSVNADGFQYCMDVPDEELSFEQLTDTEKIMTNVTNKPEDNNRKERSVSESLNECPNPFGSGWWNNNVQEWLTVSSSKTVIKNASEEDEFIVVPSLPVDDDMEFYYPRNKAGKGASSSRGSFSAQTDDGDSSIVCIGKENSVPKDDLSVWLKPRKATNPIKTIVPTKEQTASCCAAPELPSIENFRVKRKASNTSVNQFYETWKASQAPAPNGPCSLTETLSIENFLASPRRKVTVAGDKENCRYMTFPTLRMTSDCWIRKKKPKTSSISSVVSSSDRGMGLMPPTYDLPNPFWLRKYR